MFLNDRERQELQQQIRAVETTSGAEIVTVIAKASDSYAFIPVLWAALAALCVPGIYVLLLENLGQGWWPADSQLHSLHIVYTAQVLVFLVLTTLFRWQPIQMCLIPAAVKRRRAHRHAQMQFVEQRIHCTDNRTGVLLFVSMAEHYVEIIPDCKVAEEVQIQVWQTAIERLTKELKRGQLATGFSTAIETCHAALQEHFPALGNHPEQRNDQLPNHLIIVSEVPVDID